MSGKKCEVCLMYYTDDDDKKPLMIACGHTFCKSCLEKIVETANNDRLDVSCPKCRYNWTSTYVGDLPVCYQLLPTSGSDDEEENYRCKVHGRPMQVICKSCDELLCRMCLGQQHVNCELTIMNNNSNVYKRGLVKDLEVHIESLAQIKEEVRNDLATSGGSQSDLKNLCSAVMQSAEEYKSYIVKLKASDHELDEHIKTLVNNKSMLETDDDVDSSIIIKTIKDIGSQNFEVPEVTKTTSQIMKIAKGYQVAKEEQEICEFTASLAGIIQDSTADDREGPKTLEDSYPNNGTWVVSDNFSAANVMKLFNGCSRPSEVVVNDEGNWDESTMNKFLASLRKIRCSVKINFLNMSISPDESRLLNLGRIKMLTAHPSRCKVTHYSGLMHIDIESASDSFEVVIDNVEDLKLAIQVKSTNLILTKNADIFQIAQNLQFCSQSFRINFWRLSNCDLKWALSVLENILSISSLWAVGSITLRFTKSSVTVSGVRKILGSLCDLSMKKLNKLEIETNAIDQKTKRNLEVKHNYYNKLDLKITAYKNSDYNSYCPSEPDAELESPVSEYSGSDI